MTGDTIQVVILFILIILSAFFAASETALVSLSKIKIRHMIEKKLPGAETIGRIMKKPHKFISAILVGNNVVNIAAASLAASLAIKYFERGGVAYSTIIMTIVILIFGEITPKSYAARNAERISLKVAKPISLIVGLLNPITTILTFITNRIIIIFGGKTAKEKPLITEEELKTVVDVSHEEGVLEVGERQMIHNIFEFSDRKIRDIMIPRSDIVALEIKSTFDDTLKVLREQRFSKIPVYKKNIDNIIGVLYVKDLVFSDFKKDEFDISRFMRKPYQTYEFKLISSLFETMRNYRISMAIILNEYGETAGIVTIEDLVEEIVGDIRDEYDERDNEVTRLSEKEFRVKGSTKIDFVNEVTGLDIQSEEFDSIGGYIIGELGKFPEKGDEVAVGESKLVVEETLRKQIKKIRIKHK